MHKHTYKIFKKSKHYIALYGIENCSKSYFIIARALWERHYYLLLKEAWRCEMTYIRSHTREGWSKASTHLAPRAYHAQDDTELQVSKDVLRAFPLTCIHGLCSLFSFTSGPSALVLLPQHPTPLPVCCSHCPHLSYLLGKHRRSQLSR